MQQNAAGRSKMTDVLVIVVIAAVVSLCVSLAVLR
jgi:hypothetical protein